MLNQKRRGWILNLAIMLIVSLPSYTYAQEIPLGTWRMHISFNTIKSIAQADEVVYSAAENGIVVLDREENSLITYNKINGLSGAVISVIHVDRPSGLLLVGYEDGDLDVIHNNIVTNYSQLKNASVTGSKRINHISSRQGFAYLSTDYGVVVFDLAKLEVKETWRDLGENGEPLSVVQSTFLNDSIFLATTHGVLAADFRDNLLDFNNWKRFNENEFNTTINGITTFNNILYAGISNDGLYVYADGNWTKTSFLEGTTFQSMTSSSTHLLICSESSVWKINSSEETTEVQSALITTPLFALQDDADVTWIGDQQNGLLSDHTGSFTSILPNGPAFSSATRLHYYNNTVYALRGGYSASFQPLNNDGTLSHFFQGHWTTTKALVQDVTDIGFINSTPFLSSFGSGVQQGSISTPDIIYDDDNSSLINTSPPDHVIPVTSIAATPDGLWAANYGTSQSLHFFTASTATWQAFSTVLPSAQFPVKLTTDTYGNVWALLDPANGGGVLVLNPSDNESIRLTDQAGVGELPSRNVRSLALDRSGYMWLGTDKGVAYFTNPSRVFVPGAAAVRPIFENRYLLSDEKITAIAIDDGDRKWLGTERGVWLFSPTGESLLYNFTTQNSPLPSDIIQDIAINRITGEVFFATARGIVSFRSDATEDGGFDQVKVFPNPVTRDFSGLVGISGLETDAVVKITDVSGKLIWQTQANGGTATWNVHDYRGRRATTGVYLIFAATQDGSERFVGKIAVID